MSNLSIYVGPATCANTAESGDSYRTAAAVGGGGKPVLAGQRPAQRGKRPGTTAPAATGGTWGGGRSPCRSDRQVASPCDGIDRQRPALLRGRAHGLRGDGAVRRAGAAVSADR